MAAAKYQVGNVYDLKDGGYAKIVDVDPKTIVYQSRKGTRGRWSGDKTVSRVAWPKLIILSA